MIGLFRDFGTRQLIYANFILSYPPNPPSLSSPPKFARRRLFFFFFFTCNIPPDLLRTHALSTAPLYFLDLNITCHLSFDILSALLIPSNQYLRRCQLNNRVQKAHLKKSRHISRLNLSRCSSPKLSSLLCSMLGRLWRKLLSLRFLPAFKLAHRRL